MATFLEICRTVRALSGLQGTGPLSVTGVQGTEDALVRSGKEAYTEIQLYRQDWEWLESNRTFAVATGKDTYSFYDIFGTSTPEFSKYQLDSFRLTDGAGEKRYLKHRDRDVLEAMYLNSTVSSTPQYFTIDPPTQSIIIKPIPDSSSTITFRYQKSPEVLSTDTQIPSLPVQYHDLIVYNALMKMAIYLGIPELFELSRMEYDRMLGQLLRHKQPAKRLRIRPFV